MNLGELTELLSLQNQPRILSTADIAGPDRTLAYGYTTQRVSWHCYLHSGNIHVLSYSGPTGAVVSHHARPSWDVAELTPGKRVYPESVDAGFARLLLERGQELPFARFDEKRHARVAALTFHGALWDAATGTLLQDATRP
ncbi:hypothetical protein ACFYNO_15510 [Kitasatospora sp. NPDC006697]|uniref:hypothetical protein n=1 Tax=unclassified Kitasatospora TaxID=2633591 RepID=UPI003684944C